MRVSMNCAQANTGSMLGIAENARTRISKVSTPVSVEGPTLKIASFGCCGTNVGKMRIENLNVEQLFVPSGKSTDTRGHMTE